MKKIKTEVSYGHEPGENLKGELVPPYGSSIKVSGQRIQGTIDARLECPCCKAGITVRIDVDQQL